MSDRLDLRMGALCGALTVGACGAQATEEYNGEALLHLSGQATVTASTGGLTILPALCFYDTEVPDEEVNRDELPPDMAELAAEQPGTILHWPVLRVGILEAESHGRFPSSFDVSVYAPPPAELVRPIFAGEPRSVRGSVCAVRADHPDGGLDAAAPQRSVRRARRERLSTS